MTNTTGPLVRLEGVSRRYPGPPPVDALRPCTLTICDGDFVSVVGPSGSGKSTLLNLLGMLDRPSDGDYWFDGISVVGLDQEKRTILRARNVGFVFQAFHLLGYRTAAENVEIGMLYQRVPRAERRSRAHDALGEVGLSARRDTHPDVMSGGERQRVAIARAIVVEPRLLLCDEPTGNLDSATSEIVMKLLNALNRSGLTVVVVTHDPEVARWTTRSIEIRDGLATETTR